MTDPKRDDALPVRSSRNLIEDAMGAIRTVSCEEAREAIEGSTPPVLVDVREEYEYELTRLGGAVHISRGTLEMVVEHDYPDRETALLLYCAKGDRSALGAQTLQSMGYRNVASLEGGLHAWREAGLPVVDPQEQRGPGSGI